MNNNDDLLPCPFCGNDNINIQTQDAHELYQAYCVCCWAEVGWYDSIDDARKAWNKRLLLD